MSDYVEAIERVRERVEAIVRGTGRGPFLVKDEGLMMLSGFDLDGAEVRKEVELNTAAAYERFVGMVAGGVKSGEALAGLVAGAYVHGLAHGLTVERLRRERERPA